MSIVKLDNNLTGEASGETPWKFSEILADPPVRSRFEKVRKWFFLRESTYDMTSRCNIRCEGCYYYEGEKQFAKDNSNISDWQKLMRAEKERGITFVVLAGAEPALALDLCEVCYNEISWGAIATNGIKRIPGSIKYKIHISVWGNDKTSLNVRKSRDMLKRQLYHYDKDPRAVWVYTLTRQNIDEAYEVARILADEKCQMTFNMFSAPRGYTGGLKHTPKSLAKCRKVMTELLNLFPETILFSPYNAVSHTHNFALHDLFSCPYPRKNKSMDIGLGKSFRQYRTDLTWDKDAACCVPDTDCNDCRHYAAGSAVVTARMFRHAVNPTYFKAWLDYVDTYLAVWVKGYEKGQNLSKTMTPPPGFGIS